MKLTQYQLVFCTNISLLVYMIALVYYLFWDFFQYEILNYQKYEEKGMEKKLIDDGYKHYKDRSGDSDEFTSLKLYMFLQNLLKCISLRITVGKMRLFWRIINLIISAVIMFLSIYGLFRYVIPIYIKRNSTLTVETLDNYDKNELPWC